MAMMRNAMDAIALLVDDRGVDERIRDRLKRYIRLDGLTLEVGPPEDAFISPRHERRVHLTDGHAHVVTYIAVELSDRDPVYVQHIAVHLVVAFAKERYIIN